MTFERRRTSPRSTRPSWASPALGANAAGHHLLPQGHGHPCPGPVPRRERTRLRPDASWEPASLGHYLTSELDYELEIAVVIGQPGKLFGVDDAPNHVAGYVVFNDITARHIQRREMESGVFSFCKAIDTFCPLGPYIVTADEIPDLQNNRRAPPTETAHGPSTPRRSFQRPGTHRRARRQRRNRGVEPQGAVGDEVRHLERGQKLFAG